MQRSLTLVQIVAAAALFAFCGAFSRLTFQLIETRWQIAVFVVVAALLELGASNRGGQPSWLRFAANSVSVTCAIIAVKWYIEGVSPLVLALLR